MLPRKLPTKPLGPGSASADLPSAFTRFGGDSRDRLAPDLFNDDGRRSCSERRGCYRVKARRDAVDEAGCEGVTRSGRIEVVYHKCSDMGWAAINVDVGADSSD